EHAAGAALVELVDLLLAAEFRSLILRHGFRQVAIDAARPIPVTVGGEQGLKYGVRATVDGRVVERTVGYRVFRTPIETIIEVTAIEPGHCVEPLENGFTVDELDSFESVFDRVAADGALPEPSTFQSVRSNKPGSSADPRRAQVPSAGLGTEHRPQQQ
ncbi:MAG: hypothetical protein KY393_02160, partial [Actinobacteria bacterium]|nr:hypothetical protein [Actinomycetota bacterium]